MPIRTSKTKIHRKIHVVNNIQTDSVLNLNSRHIWSECSLTTCPGRDAVLRHALVRPQFYTCAGRVAVFRHAIVGAQFYDMTLGGTQFYNIPWSGRSNSTFPGQDAVLRNALVGTQFYDFPCSGCSYSTCPGRDTVYDMPGLDAVLRHAQ